MLHKTGINLRNSINNNGDQGKNGWDVGEQNHPMCLHHVTDAQRNGETEPEEISHCACKRYGLQRRDQRSTLAQANFD